MTLPTLNLMHGIETHHEKTLICVEHFHSPSQINEKQTNKQTITVTMYLSVFKEKGDFKVSQGMCGLNFVNDKAKTVTHVQ